MPGRHGRLALGHGDGRVEGPHRRHRRRPGGATTSTAGEFRRSSVPALKVSPQTATTDPRSPRRSVRRRGTAAGRTLSTTRSNCSSLVAMAPFRKEKS